MLIREVQSKDRRAWLAMLLELYEDSVESDHVSEVDAYLSGGESENHLPTVVFVCEDDDAKLCGLLELSIRNYAEGCTGATPYIESWYVTKKSRQSGVGRLLMEAAEQWALKEGFSELASDALLSNTVSHRAHEALGFFEVERAVHFRKSLKDSEEPA